MAQCAILEEIADSEIYNVKDWISAKARLHDRGRKRAMGRDMVRSMSQWPLPSYAHAAQSGPARHYRWQEYSFLQRSSRPNYWDRRVEPKGPGDARECAI